MIKPIHVFFFFFFLNKHRCKRLLVAMYKEWWGKTERQDVGIISEIFLYEINYKLK